MHFAAHHFSILKNMFGFVFFNLINLVGVIQFCSINRHETIQTDGNMIYAYYGPNVTKRFCDFFFVVVGRGKKALLWKGNKPSS